MNKKLFFAVLAGVALASCTTENFYQNEEKEITFTPVSRLNQSRAIVDKTDYPTDVPFGAYAWVDYTDGGQRKFDAYMNDVEISYGDLASVGNTWRPATPYYWPPFEGSNLDFICYSPFTATIKPKVTITKSESNKTKTITYTGEINPNTSDDYLGKNDADLMYSDLMLGKNSGNTPSGLTFTFHHALAQIAINFTNKTLTQANGAGEIKYAVNVTKVEFNTIKTNGEFKLTTTGNEWPTAPTIWTDKGTNGDATKITFEKTLELTGSAQPYINKVVMPQELGDGVNVTISYSVTTTIGSLSQTVAKSQNIQLNKIGGIKTWNTGKKITYNVTIDPSNNLKPIYFVPTVTNWETQAGSPSDITPNK